MKFSIIIPCFNKSLEVVFRTLFSICIQKFPRDQYEIIFVNDGDKKHDYESLVKCFQLWGINIKYFYLDNSKSGSPVFAWNYGIMKSKGTIIILNGADILHLNQTLLHFDRLFLNRDEDVNIEDCVIHKSFKNPAKGVGFNEKVIENPIKDNLILCVGYVYRYLYNNSFYQKLFLANEWPQLLLENKLLEFIETSIKPIDKLRSKFVMLTGVNRLNGYPFLVAARADLFFEMGGFNEAMYRIGWDDYDWWLRSTFFAKTVFCPKIKAIHQWHRLNSSLKKDNDKNRHAGIVLMRNLFDKYFIRPTANIGIDWGTFNKMENKYIEEIISSSESMRG